MIAANAYFWNASSSLLSEFYMVKADGWCSMIGRVFLDTYPDGDKSNILLGICVLCLVRCKFSFVFIDSSSVILMCESPSFSLASFSS